VSTNGPGSVAAVCLFGLGIGLLSTLGVTAAVALVLKLAVG
jgi:hypothetical protein